MSLTIGHAALGAPTVIDTFFEGLDEVRAKLDLADVDPQKRRARLGSMARDLLKVRAAPELGLRLVTRLHEAVGGPGCCLLLESSRDRPWVTAGDVVSLPTQEQIAEVLTTGTPLVAGDNLLVPIRGLHDSLGALWMLLERPLDDETLQLLQALADTAGVVLEQGLSADVQRLANPPHNS